MTIRLIREPNEMRIWLKQIKTCTPHSSIKQVCLSLSFNIYLPVVILTNFKIQNHISSFLVMSESNGKKFFTLSKVLQQQRQWYDKV